MSLGPLLDSLIVKIDPILLGNYLGRTALILFAITLTPGIFRRMVWFTHQNIVTKFVQYVSRYRAKFGISTYLFALSHFIFVRVFPFWPNVFRHPFAIFEWFGVFALLLLTPMFLTSNKYSYKKLGKNWKKLHKVVYIIIWLVFLHVGLQGTWYLTLIILVVGILEIVSFINARKTAVERENSTT